MSSAHEVVTIQAGTFANFIGTHWWNIQESSFCYSPEASAQLDINHDVMFREGLNFLGEVTYTPRLILIDSNDSLLSVRKQCPLYRSSEEDSSESLWEGPVEVIKEDPIQRNPYLEEPVINKKLTNTVEDKSSPSVISSSTQHDFNSSSTVWSDFLKTNLHPRSLCLFPELNASSEENTSRNFYSYGEELYMNIAKDSIEDTVRRMTEECDYLQGFHVLFDAHNCFSALTSQILQYLDDEYKRRPSLCFPVYQENNKQSTSDMKEEMHRLYATLNSMNNMNSCCSFFSPLSLSEDIVKLSPPFREFPFLKYDETLMYHTSAILAATIETLTSPYRLRSRKFNMGDISSLMSTYGRKLVCSSVCLPFPLDHDAYLRAMIEKDVPEHSLVSLTPCYKPGTERTLFQSAVLRGVPINKFQNPKKSMYHSSEPEEIFGEYLNKYSPSSVTSASVFYEKCNVDAPFPKIFRDTVSDSGFLNSNILTKRTGITQVPTAASFSNSDSSGQFLEDILSRANKLSFKEFVKSSETSYERDNFQEVIEGLIGLQDNYQHYS